MTLLAARTAPRRHRIRDGACCRDAHLREHATASAPGASTPRSLAVAQRRRSNTYWLAPPVCTAHVLSQREHMFEHDRGVARPSAAVSAVSPSLSSSAVSSSMSTEAMSARARTRTRTRTRCGGRALLLGGRAHGLAAAVYEGSP